MKTLAFLWFFMILKNLRKLDEGKSWHINDFKCVLELAEQKVAWIIQIRHQWGFFFPLSQKVEAWKPGKGGVLERRNHALCCPVISMHLEG